MNIPLYAVMKDGDLHAVFSNEGLAMTHLAKLRAVPVVGYDADCKLVPIVMNEAVSAENVYLAYQQCFVGDIGYDTAALNISVDDVAAELPPPTIEGFGLQDSEGSSPFIEFAAYGWSETEADAALQELFTKHASGEFTVKVMS